MKEKAMPEKDKGLIGELTDDATTNPDAPENSDATPPQTTGNEDTSGWAPERIGPRD